MGLKNPTQEVRGIKTRLDFIDCRIAKVEAWEGKLDAVEQQLRERARSPARRRSLSPGSYHFACGEEGHYRYECPRPPTVTFEDQIRCWGCGEQRLSNASSSRSGSHFSSPLGKLGRTDHADQSSVQAAHLHLEDSSPEFSVEDSVGQTTLSLPNEILGESVEEDGRFRPRSVSLLGDSRVIDSKELKPRDAREEDGRCRSKDVMGVEEEIMKSSTLGGLSGWGGKRSGSPAVSVFHEYRTCVRCSFPPG